MAEEVVVTTVQVREAATTGLAAAGEEVGGVRKAVVVKAEAAMAAG